MNITEIHSFSSAELVTKYIPDTLKNTVELIVLDVNMTLKNCEGICQKIELLNRWIDVPILFSTTYEKAETIDCSRQVFLILFLRACRFGLTDIATISQENGKVIIHLNGEEYIALSSAT